MVFSVGDVAINGSLEEMKNLSCALSVNLLIGINLVKEQIKEVKLISYDLTFSKISFTAPLSLLTIFPTKTGI